MNNNRLLLSLLMTSITGPAFADDDEYKFTQTDIDFARVEDELVFTWDSEVRVGGDSNRFWFKSEGEVEGGMVEEAEIQALYGRYIGRDFDVQAGVRHDFRPNEFGQTTYFVIGLQGNTPYDFEVEVPLFVSENGDVSFRPEVEYEIEVTDDLAAEIYFEANFYLTQNPGQMIGKGLTEIDTGVKIQYEIWRGFAPYIDFNHVRSFGIAKTEALSEDEKTKDLIIRLGARITY